MKGDPQVIDFLNKALLNELTAVNQYWLHYRMLDNWGVRKLADYERHESIDEMKHADMLAERILMLEGLPNFQALGKLHIGEDVKEVLECDLKLEHEAIPLLKDAIAHAESARDYVSREIFERILENEEEHVDFLETQFEMIERMGIQNYIQLNSEAAGSS
jgi:bacterioferritin